MYCTADDVILFTGLKPTHLHLEKTDTEKLNGILEDWIKQSGSLIDNYCNKTFETNTPPFIKNICLRITANMVALSQARRNTPIIKVDDWSVEIINSDIFTDDLKRDLSDFLEEDVDKSSRVDVFTITGEGATW